MDATGHRSRRERAQATLETVGLAVGVAVLLAALASGIGVGGRPLGESVGARVTQLVGGERATSSSSVQLPSGRRRVWHERQVSGGRVPLHVPRDELRLTPIVDPLALWGRHWSREGQVVGVDARVDAKACAMCTALEWSHSMRSGAGVDPRGGDVGFEGTIRAAARLAIASADATVRAQRVIGPVTLSGQGRVRGTIGGDADGEAKLRVSGSAQELELDGTAMAGAVARAEGKLGINLLGIAIRQGGRVEGWAGAGARGTVGVRRESDRLTWRFGWGAALGLGGAGEWNGSIDVSAVPKKHRDLLRSSLALAMRMGPLPVSPFNFR